MWGGIKMDRDTVRAGLRAYRLIGEEIASREELAEYGGDSARARLEIESLQSVRRKITECLEELPTLERELIRRHYIDRVGWVCLARKYAYTERHVRNIAGWGLDHLGTEVQKDPLLTEYFARTKKQSHH